MIVALVIASLVAGLLIGASVTDVRTFRRDRRRRQRRREQIERDGADAVECWLTDIEAQRQQPSNGTPFEGESEAV